MLSITSISIAQAERYYQQDNYYLASKGQWMGKGADAFGLKGEVDREEFVNLLNGRGPEGKELVVSAHGKHRAGVDLTFSAPKSVSILSEILGDERVGLAHERAVAAALGYAERHFSQARQTQNGLTEKVTTRNFVVAAFPHNVSRELDPQLHIHAVIMNVTRRPDGQWRALSNEELYSNKMLLGQIYRNELGMELQRLGYAIEVTDKRKGLLEVKGIGDDLIRLFSRRSEQIEKRVASLKESGAYPNANEQKLREIAALGSRDAKRDVDMRLVREVWKERVAEMGLDIGDIKSRVRLGKGTVKDEKARDGMEIAIRGLETMSSVWTRHQMLKEAMRLETGRLTIEMAEKRVSSLLKGRRLICLTEGKYTTREALKTELSIIDNVRERHGDSHGFKRDDVLVYIDSKASFLNEGQRNAVAFMAASKDGVLGVHGDAGVGKTTMLKAAKKIFERDGYTVRGMGFTGKSAEALEREAGIRATTISAFKGDTRGAREVWFVDEASLVGNRQMLDVLEKARDARAKVILIGDCRQMQPIEAGKAFQALQEKGVLNTVMVSEIVRQKGRLLKDAVHAVAKEHDPEKAVSILESGGAVKEIKDRDGRLRAITEEYLSLEEKLRAGTLIVTAQNSDRAVVNNLIRGSLKESGELEVKDKIHEISLPKNLSGIDRLDASCYAVGDIIIFTASNKTIGVTRGEKGAIAEIKDDFLIVQTGVRTVSVDPAFYQKFEAYEEVERGFAAGDRVVFLKNDKELGVRNGTVGSVVEITETGLKIETASGVKAVDLGRYNHIDHGYAMTVHKSQGQTVDRMIVNVDTAQERMNNANSFYVSISRAREAITVYTDSKKDLPEAVGKWQEKETALDYAKEISDHERTGTDLDMREERGPDKEHELER